jgi:hypothetical protein
MQCPRPPGRIELTFQPGDPLADQPAVDFKLAFTRPTEEPEPAPLAFEMRPRPHEARPLVGERRELDLQPALMGARPRAEDLEDQTRAIDDLRLPTPLEVTLLHRAERRIDDDEPDLIFADQLAEGFKGAAAQQAARARTGDARELGADDVQADRLGEPDCFFEPSFDRTAGIFCGVPSKRHLRHRMHHKCSTGRGSV